jgi:hypothetical protein
VSLRTDSQVDAANEATGEWCPCIATSRQSQTSDFWCEVRPRIDSLLQAVPSAARDTSSAVDARVLKEVARLLVMHAHHPRGVLPQRLGHHAEGDGRLRPLRSSHTCIAQRPSAFRLAAQRCPEAARTKTHKDTDNFLCQ